MKATLMYLFAAMVLIFLPVVPAQADTITVTTGLINIDFGGGQLPADLPGADGVVSFREALIAANNNAGPDTIEFAIPQPWLWQISIGYPGRAVIDLSGTAIPPQLTGDDTTIDFTTQTAFTGDTNPDGNEVAFFSGASGPSFAFVVNGDRCVIRGLDAGSRPIALTGNDNAVVGFSGGASIDIFGAGGGGRGNIIGGSGPGEGNRLTYLDIDRASDNVVRGNVILGRLKVDGATAGDGLTVNNVIGGPDPADGNIIYGVPVFSGEGVASGYVMRVMAADATLIENNQLGLTEGGLISAGDQFGGNGLATGIRVGSGSTDTLIRNNRIAGIIGRGILQWAGFRSSNAIWLDGDSVGTTIQGNIIGLNVVGDPLGSVSGIGIGNAGTGFVVPSGTLVGGIEPGQGNEIAGHDALGIFMHLNAERTTILGNSIHDNAGLGIDLMSETGSLGVTVNDTLDVDGGPNQSQNYPEIADAHTGFGLVSVDGFLDAVPNESYRVEVFSSPACDDSGFGEGETFLGAVDLSTDGSGQGVLAAAFPALTTVPGAAITSTATRLSSGETSEFSACAEAIAFTSEPATDVDGDNLSDVIEVDIGSDPNDPDSDDDGLADGSDNCILSGNAGQTDSDDDGYGNACDADFNNDNVVNTQDLGYLKSVYFSADALGDLNDDGVVNVLDLAILKATFFQAPGPSAL